MPQSAIEHQRRPAPREWSRKSQQQAAHWCKPGELGLVAEQADGGVREAVHIAGSLAGPRVAAAIGERRAMPGGLLAVAAGALALLAIAPAGSPLASLLGGFTLMGAGLGVASVASTARGTAALGAADQGLASGLLATGAQVGTVHGLAVLVPVAAARTAAHGGSPAGEVAGYELGFVLAAGLALVAAVAVGRPARARAAAPPPRRRESAGAPPAGLEGAYARGRTAPARRASAPPRRARAPARRAGGVTAGNKYGRRASGG